MVKAFHADYVRRSRTITLDMKSMIVRLEGTVEGQASTIDGQAAEIAELQTDKESLLITVDKEPNSLTKAASSPVSSLTHTYPNHYSLQTHLQASRALQRTLKSSPSPDRTLEPPNPSQHLSQSLPPSKRDQAPPQHPR